MTDTTHSKTLAVKCPGEFTGKQENWERWKVKYTNYTSSIDWRYGALFREIEDMARTEKINKEWIDDWDIANPTRISDKTTREAMQLSTDLYAQLTDLLQGTAANLCKRHSKARCGLNVWKELCHHYGIKTSLKVRGKLAKIMNYHLPEADFHSHFTAWLTLIAEYEEEAGKELDEDIKIDHITYQVTGPLAFHLRLSPDLTDFDDICELVHNFYAPTKIEGDSKQSDGINALNWGKDGKGKGKGKGD